MDWQKLLATKRLGCERIEAATPWRSPFETDMDRVTFSSAFRRLADKMQVHGPAANDMVRTRLTHSLEAARVGRALGAWAGRSIVQKLPAGSEITPTDIGAVVACAAAAHDMGTPPFGHQGEDVANEWFATSALGREALSTLSERDRLEFENFEGNAHGFRLLASLQGYRPTGGLRLTCATLGAFTKYPWGVEARTKKGKYGHFASEADAFREVADACGLLPGAAPDTWARHPLAHLVEAADDICYTIADVEDGVSMGRLAYEEAEDLLRPLASCVEGFEPGDVASRKLAFWRSRAIERLIASTVDAFLGHHDEILSGTFQGPLVSALPETPALREIIRVSTAKIYRGGQRDQVDIIAQKTMARLLETYTAALLERERFEAVHGVGARLPVGPRAVLRFLPDAEQGPRDRAGWLRQMMDYISGMTDGFAADQAKLLTC